MKENLILLHGALGSSKDLLTLQEILNEDFNVHSLNFSGHNSTPITGDFSIRLFTEDIIAFMDQHQLEKAHFFGYSMGGYVALNLAHRYPMLVQSVYTYGTKFNWNPDQAQKETAFLNPSAILEKVPKYATYLQALYGENWENVLEKTAQMMLDLGSNPVISGKFCKEIFTSVRISHGTKDQMVSEAESRYIAESLPKGHFYSFEGWEHPIARLNLVELANQMSNWVLNQSVNVFENK